MDKTIASNAVFDRVTGVLAGLDFQVTDVAWQYGTMAEANVRMAGRKVARISFTGYEDCVRLIVHPVDPKSYQILAGRGRVMLDERLDREINDIEAFFRTLLVKRKKLDFADYPTDYALKGFVADVARVSVPRDGEQKKFHARSEVAIRCVELARRLEADFDRATALRLHVFAADYDVVLDSRGHYVDDAVGHIRDVACSASDTVYGRHALAWQTGSSGSHLFMKRKPAPERVVMEAHEDLAPAMAM